jgi:hypothetical protein
LEKILPGKSTITSANRDNPFPARFDGILVQVRGKGPVWVIYGNGRFQVPDDVREGVPITPLNFMLERTVPFTLTGRVTDTTGAPIAATVRLTQNNVSLGRMTPSEPPIARTFNLIIISNGCGTLVKIGRVSTTSIECCKFTEGSAGCSVVSDSRFYLRFESAKIAGATVNRNLGHPSVVYPKNAAYFIIGDPVCAILLATGLSKVTNPIVETISINVIYLLFRPSLSLSCS